MGDQCSWKAQPTASHHHSGQKISQDKDIQRHVTHRAQSSNIAWNLGCWGTTTDTKKQVQAINKFSVQGFYVKWLLVVTKCGLKCYKSSRNLIFLQVSLPNISEKLINTSGEEMFLLSEDCRKCRFIFRETHHSYFYFFFFLENSKYLLTPSGRKANFLLVFKKVCFFLCKKRMSTNVTEEGSLLALLDWVAKIPKNSPSVVSNVQSYSNRPKHFS